MRAQRAGRGNAERRRMEGSGLRERNEMRCNRRLLRGCGGGY